MSKPVQQTDSSGDRCLGSFRIPTFEEGSFTHILIGDYAALIAAINLRAVLHYCDRIKWMQPLPTGRGREHITPMTRRILAQDS